MDARNLSEASVLITYYSNIQKTTARNSQLRTLRTTLSTGPSASPDSIVYVCVCMRLLLPDLVHIQQSKSLCPEHTFKHTQVLIGCHFIHYYHDERNRERSQQIRRCAGNGAHCGRPSRWPSVYSRTTALLPRSIALCTNDGIATSRPTDQYQSPVVPHLWYCRYPGLGHYSRSHCHLPRRQCQTRNSEYRFERRAGTVSGQCWYCVRFRGVGFVDYPRGRLGGLVRACVVVVRRLNNTSFVRVYGGCKGLVEMMMILCKRGRDTRFRIIST